MRDRKNNMETNAGRVKQDMGTTKKQVHDMTRQRKFVSDDAASIMKAKKASRTPTGA